MVESTNLIVNTNPVVNPDDLFEELLRMDSEEQKIIDSPEILRRTLSNGNYFLN
jgi:hypothetical protein